MPAIKAYRADDTLVSSGDASHPVDCGAVARGQSGSAVVAHVAADAGYQRLGAYTISLSGTYADRYRLSADLASWSDWGASIVLAGPISGAPTIVYVQKRALAGDPVGGSATPAQLVLPQDNIVTTSSGLLPDGVDMGLALDAGTFLLIRPFSGDDAGQGTESVGLSLVGALADGDVALGSDAGSLSSAASIEGTDAGSGPDAGAVYAVFVLPNVDSPVSGDIGTLETLVVDWLFTGANGAAPDTAKFVVFTASSGTCAQDGANHLTSYSPSNAAIANAIDKTPITHTAYVVKVKYQATAVTTTQNPLSLIFGAGDPPSANPTNYLIKADLTGGGTPYKFCVKYWNATPAEKYLKGDGSGTEGTDPLAAGFGYLTTTATDYVIVLTVTTTQWRVELKSADEGTTHYTTGFINWSGTADIGGANLYATLGDWLTGAGYGTLLFTSYHSGIV